MIYAVALFLVGLMLSAFFSGAETGLYRVTRVRLVIDALGGDRIARSLLWMTNHPSVFVATVLVGNNVANYLVSLGVVLGIVSLFPSAGPWPPLLAPVLLTPIVFVYGESMPKLIFFESPNRLLRRVGPLLILAKWLFAPAVALFWLVSRIMERIIGESPQKLRLRLARRELEHVMEEGHAAGILLPSQRALVQGMFSLSRQPVREFATPVGRIIHATTAMNRQEMLRLARRHSLVVMPVEDVKDRRRVIGYVRVVDLYLDESDHRPEPRPLVDIRADEPFISSLVRLQKEETSPLGRVIDEDNRTIGYVTARQLSKTLFRGH